MNSTYACHGVENSLATLFLTDPVINRRLAAVMAQ